LGVKEKLGVLKGFRDLYIEGHRGRGEETKGGVAYQGEINEGRRGGLAKKKHGDRERMPEGPGGKGSIVRRKPKTEKKKKKRDGTRATKG